MAGEEGGRVEDAGMKTALGWLRGGHSTSLAEECNHKGRKKGV